MIGRTVPAISILALIAAWPAVVAAQGGADAAPAAQQPTNGPVAQNDPAADDAQAASSDIVVTGIRASIQAGVDIKRNSTQFVDAVVAEDIGKLPDTNVAESLSRVSGVQLTRGIGGGSDITVRGLRQNLTLLNGRTVIDSGGRGSAGNDSLGTATYGLLGSLPAELIARLEVTKQPAASQLEGALGGTVNIVTRRPLDTRGFQAAGSAQIDYSDRREKPGYRASVLLSDTFADDTFGALLNVAYNKSRVRDDSFTSFNGYRNLTTAFNTNTLGVRADPNGDGVAGIRIDDLRYQRIDDDRERVSINGALQWKPSAETEFYLESLYNKLDVDRERHWFSFATSGNGTDYTAATLTADETLIGGTVRAPLQANYELYRVDGDLWTSALGGTWNTDRFRLFGEVTYTKAKQDGFQNFVRNSSGTAAGLTSFPISFDIGAGDVPSIVLPAGASTTNPAGFVITNIQDNHSTLDSDAKEARLDFTYKVDGGFLKSIEIGARGARYTTKVIQRQSILGGLFIPVSSFADKFEVYGNRDFLSGTGGGPVPGPYLSATAAIVGDAICTTVRASLPNPAACTPELVNPTGTYRLAERTANAYVQLNFDTEMLGRSLSGNAGVRYVETRLTSTGSLIRPGNVIEPNVARVTTKDWLPSAVLRLAATDRLVLRLGAARVLARPQLLALNNGLTVNGVPAGSGGNPFLKPFKADQVDASLEWYFSRSGVISAGLFYKDVKSFIVTRTQDEVVPGFAQPIPVTRQRNGDSGKIKGLELLVQQPFTFLPAPFDGLGVLANYSYIDSTTPLIEGRSGRKLPIDGLSRHNVNLIGYFESGPVELRLAYNFRTKYLGGIGLNDGAIFNDTYNDLSATFRYEINDRVALDLQVSNLLDEGVRRYGSVSEVTSNYGVSGRVFSAGLRARF